LGGRASVFSAAFGFLKTGFPGFPLFQMFTVINVYIKLVVIVNDEFTVDKMGLLHRISGLRAAERAGQGLYPACTDVGEKTSCLQ
jgi:hypothetical protein